MLHFYARLAEGMSTGVEFLSRLRELKESPWNYPMLTSNVKLISLWVCRLAPHYKVVDDAKQYVEYQL